MHGFFVDIRLYRKAKSVAEPFAFEEYKRKKVREKIEEDRTNRVKVQVRKCRRGDELEICSKLDIVLGLLCICHKKRGNLLFIKYKKKEDVLAKKEGSYKNRVYKYSKFYEMKSALSFPRKYIKLKTKTLQLCVQYTNSVLCVASSLLNVLLICPFILLCRIPIKEFSALYY